MIFKTRTPPSEWCSKRQAPPRGHGQRTVFFPSLPRPPLSRVPVPLSHSGHYVTLFPECDSWQPLFSAGRGLLLIQACTLEGRRGLMCLPSDGPQLPFSPSLLPRDPVALQSDDTCGGGRCRDLSFRTSGSSQGALSSSEQWLPSLASQRFLTSPPHGDLGRRNHSCHPPQLRPPSRTPGNVKGGPLLLCQRFRSGSEVGQGARSRDAVPGTTSVLPATPALAG